MVKVRNDQELPPPVNMINWVSTRPYAASS